MNSKLKQKMENIQTEVIKFSENIDKFATICDEELEDLLDNIDTVTQSIQ